MEGSRKRKAKGDDSEVYGLGQRLVYGLGQSWMMASFTKIRNICKGTAIGGGKISSVLDSLD